VTAIVEPVPSSTQGSAILPARPEPVRIGPADTAVIVIDMQNAYASAGGYVDKAGFDVAPAAAAIAQIARVL
jgi:ureidoacrylate peracid hydrolase